jgi:hypothetical protein
LIGWSDADGKTPAKSTKTRQINQNHLDKVIFVDFSPIFAFDLVTLLVCGVFFESESAQWPALLIIIIGKAPHISLPDWHHYTCTRPMAHQDYKSGAFDSIMRMASFGPTHADSRPFAELKTV